MSSVQVIENQMRDEDTRSLGSSIEDVIASPSIVSLLKQVKEHEDLKTLASIQQRFRVACAENDLVEGYKQADCIDVMDKFLSGLKDISFSRKCEFDPWDCEGSTSDYGLTNGRLRISEQQPGRFLGYQNYKVHFTLIEPKIKDDTLPSKIDVLFRRSDELNAHTCEVFYELGNKHLVATLPEDELIRYENDIEVARRNLTWMFDDKNRVYNCCQDEDLFMVFQKNLRVNNSPTELIRGIENVRFGYILGVYGNKLYLRVSFNTEPFTESIYCIDVETKVMIQAVPDKGIDINASGAPFENGIVLMSENFKSLIYFIDGNKLVCKRTKSIARKRLNQHTFIQKTQFLDTYQIRTFSFINGKVIENHVQSTELKSMIGRYNDHVFVVLGLKSRSIWYEDRPGSKPILIHSDNRGTEMKQVRRHWIPTDNKFANIFER